MTQPLLSILIPALRSRRPARGQLESELYRQIAQCPEQIELLIDEDNGEAPSGTKRNRLHARARGHYLAFCDDDDQVAPDYLLHLRAGLLQGGDLVSFHLARHDTRPDGPGDQVFEFGSGNVDHTRLPNGHRAMASNPVCAWRAEIARAMPFVPWIGYNDDCGWYKPLLASGLVKSEVVIPEILYHYTYDPAVTVNQQEARRQKTRLWAAGGVECFRDRHPLTPSPRLYIAAQNLRHTAGRELVDVIAPGGVIIQRRRDTLERFFIFEAR